MDKKNVFTKMLAITGTILTWIPIVFTMIISIIGTLVRRTFLFDYLMPAELFPIALVGGLLLLWASWQAIAIVSGLASGAIPLADWPFALVISSIIFYSLSLIEIGVMGILLVKKIF